MRRMRWIGMNIRSVKICRIRLIRVRVVPSFKGYWRQMGLMKPLVQPSKIFRLESIPARQQSDKRSLRLSRRGHGLTGRAEIGALDPLH